jgi:hypothetical protein
MAIGKVNAYATVQAPNVDFGDIALNAQKFQDADIEKQKELKVAQLKAKKIKPEKFDPYKVDDKTSNNGTIDYLKTKLVNQSIDLYNQAKQNGDEVTAGKVDANVKKILTMSQSISEAGKKFGEMKQSGKISGLENDRLDWYGNMVSGDGMDGYVSPSGSMYVYAVEKDEKGKKILNVDGSLKKKIIKDSKGMDVSELSDFDIINNLNNDLIPSVQLNDELLSLAKTTAPYSQKAESGDSTIGNVYLQKEDVDNLGKLIESKLKTDHKYFQDILYKSNPNKYNQKLKQDEYTPEMYGNAKDFLLNSVRQVYDLSYTKQQDEPKQNININYGGGADPKIFTRFANTPSTAKTDVKYNYTKPNGDIEEQVIPKGSTVLTFGGRKGGKNENLVSTVDKISAGDFYRTPGGIIVAKVNEFKKYTTDDEGSVSIQDPTPNYKLIQSNTKGPEFNRALSLLRGDNETSDGKNINIKTINDLNRFFDYERTKNPKYLKPGSSPYGVKKTKAKVDEYGVPIK